MNYDDIIMLDHYEPRFHKRMDKYNRAGQFAAFQALKGFEDLVIETSRLVEKEKNIDEQTRTILNNKLNYIKERIDEKPEVNFIYFVKDNKKDGGKYKKITNRVEKINTIDNYIKFVDKTIIPIKDIVEISGNLFKNIY